MKVVLLAGGLGTRISEYTDTIPKPMIEVGGLPVLEHIINHYARYGMSDFIIAGGYKVQIIKKYFHDYYLNISDLKINLSTGDVSYLNKSALDWSVTVVDTGLNSMTGGRLHRLRDIIGDERFLLTYGDGLSNVPINELIASHEVAGKLLTVTAVRPSARFGELELSGSDVVGFREKPRASQGWINGGFFVCEPGILNYLESDDTVLEGYPMEKIAQDGELNAYFHEGFWQCMDTVRDKIYLESLIENGTAPWL